MTITKEQIDIFNKHFNVIETTQDISIHKADFTVEDLQEFQDTPDEFFMNINWNIKESSPFQSEGYAIIDIQSETEIVEISDLTDIINFIESDMDKYIK